MSYSRFKAFDAGRSYSGISPISYKLTGASPITAGITELLAGSGIFGATVVFPDGFAGAIVWQAGEGEDARYAVEEINPGLDEYTDAKTSAVPTATWSAGSRTLTSFAFTVPATVAGGVVLAANGLDAVIVEPPVSGGQQLNARQALSAIAAGMAGNLAKLGANSYQFAAAGNPTVPRLTTTLAEGGRTLTLALPS